MILRRVTLDKVWLRSYPPGVPPTVDVDRYSSLLELFHSSVEKYKDNIAFSSLGVLVTYQELDILSNHLAVFLQQGLKLKKGDCFAIMLPNILQFPVALFAALKAGLIVVNVNPFYTVPELAHQLKDSGAVAILVFSTVTCTLEQALDQTDIQHIIVTEVGDLLGWFKGSILNGIMRFKKSSLKKCILPKVFYFKAALKRGASVTFKKVVVHPEDIALLQYTGGTTGHAKGAILTHHNLVANVIQNIAWVESLVEPGKEVSIIALPLYHIFSLMVSCLSFISIGVHGVLIADPRRIGQFVSEIKSTQPTIFVGLNTLFRMLLDDLGFQSLDFSHFKLTIAGGMPTQKDVVERWKQITGMTIIEGYGLTEASPVISINPVNLNLFNHSIGLPIPNTQIQIRGEDGKVVENGKTGELWVRGPQTMKGYWNQPEETVKVLDEEGWLFTGDMARLDEAGFLYMMDRKKDMISVSGFKIYPNEIEEVIEKHPKVDDVGVVGIPDDKTGEAVKAFVVKREGDLTQPELIQFCREQLTGYKIPKEIE